MPLRSAPRRSNAPKSPADLLRREAVTGISDLQAHLLSRCQFACERDRPRRTIIFHGIGKQVQDDLLDSLAVGQDMAGATF